MSASLRALLRRPLVANSAALIALRAGNLAARLVLLFVIARVVSPASFGVVVLAVSAAEVAKVVADFGMDTIAIRTWAAGTPGAAHHRFAAALGGAKLLFGIAVYAALAAWFALTRPGEPAVLGAIVGLTVLTSLLTNFSLDWYQARLSIARVLAPVMAATVLLTLAAALLLPRLPDLRAQVALLPAIELAGGIVLLARLRRTGLAAPPPTLAGVGALVRASLPVAATAILIVTYSRLDVLVLASRLDAAAVGHYGVAFRLTEPFQLAAAAFGLSVFSRFSTWFHDPAGMSLARAAFRYIVATLGYGIAAALAVGLLAPPVIERMLPAYAPAIPALRWLALALVFRSVNATLAGILQGGGRFRTLTALAAWNLLVVFALLHAWVGRIGVVGAALALLVAEALNTVLELALVIRMVTSHGRSHSHGR